MLAKYSHICWYVKMVTRNQQLDSSQSFTSLVSKECKHIVRNIIKTFRKVTHFCAETTRRNNRCKGLGFYSALQSQQSGLTVMSLEKKKKKLWGEKGNWQVTEPGIHLLSFEIWWTPFLPETN